MRKRLWTKTSTIRVIRGQPKRNSFAHSKDNMSEKIDDYFVMTLGQLMRHPDHGIKNAAQDFNLAAGIISPNMTLTELLEHRNNCIQIEAHTLLNEIEDYLERQKEKVHR